jgi:hypothetical protein
MQNQDFIAKNSSPVEPASTQSASNAPLQSVGESSPAPRAPSNEALSANLNALDALEKQASAPGEAGASEPTATADGEAEKPPATASASHSAAPSIDARRQHEEPSGQAPKIDPPRASLIPFVPPAPHAPGPGAFRRLVRGKRLRWGAAVATLALAAAGGASVMGEDLRSRGLKLEALGESVAALEAKLDAIDTAKPIDDATAIRKAVADARGGLALSRDVSVTIAQLNARIDRLEHDQGGRVDKLGDRLDRETAARSTEAQARDADLAGRLDKLERADLAARMDKLEKKSQASAAATPTTPSTPDRETAARSAEAQARDADLAGRLDKLERADLAARMDKLEKKSQASAAATPTTPSTPASATQTSAASAPASASNEMTAAIQRPQPSAPIRGWVLLEIRNGVALVENRQGLREISLGETVPGAGRVQRFERRGRQWVVVTDQGVIAQGPIGGYREDASLRPPGYIGGYGAYYGRYGDGEY